MSLLITDAGIAASIRAGNLGISYHISEMSIGTQGYTPTADQTALRHEVQRKAITRSELIGLSLLHFETVWDGDEAFIGKELGYWLDDGTLFAVDSREGDVITYKQKDTVVTEVCELNLAASSIENITVEFVGTPQATEERAGIAEIATQSEVDEGDSDKRFVTPKKLKAPLVRASHTLGQSKSLGVIRYQPKTINANETIPDNVNADVIGPSITIADGVTVVVGENSILTVR
ncbi:phage tail protein [Vibrio splendidus]|uniref:phage tail-collar fiber domain-containing protein n=1 Tax=Vibrio splendidus TaxID=29497 RepID=UPI00352C9F2D